MTTDQPLTTDAILDAFASAERWPPLAALQQAVERWPEVAPALLAILNAAADNTDRSERSKNILSFGIYLMAQMRETRAYRPLCTMAAAADLAYEVMGDGASEDLSVIFARLYDGDPAPLRSLIEATDADEFTRATALGTLAWLTAAGTLDRDETARYFRDLHATLQPKGTNQVWVGWQQAIARLGLDELVPLVEDAFNRGWVDESVLSLRHFHEDLRAARQAADPTAVFDVHERDDGRFDDVTRLISGWHFRPAEEDRRAAPANNEPIRNPYRGVGRNDPCPCGSGKKFKKCCLETVR